MISLLNFTSVSSHRNHPMLVGFIPQMNVVVFLFKRRHLTSIVSQINRNLVIRHRTNHGVFDEFGIQLRVQKHILNGSWNVLILIAFGNGIFTKLGLHLMSVSKYNIAILLIPINDTRSVYPFVYFLLYVHPLGVHFTLLAHEYLAPISTVDKPKCHSTPMLKGQNEIRIGISYHFVNDIRVRVRKIKSIERLLFTRNTQLQFVGVVEKQQRS